MIIKSISYQKVKNLGNYESERLEATATVVEDENVAEAVSQLRAFVEFQLDVKVSQLLEKEHNPLFDDDDGIPMWNMYPCKLSDDHWLNLASVRSVEVEYGPKTLVKVTWITGDSSIYRDKDATLLMEAWFRLYSRTQV